MDLKNVYGEKSCADNFEHAFWKKSRTCGGKITNFFFLAWMIWSMLRSKWNMCRVSIHVSEKLRNRILHYLSNSSIKIYYQLLYMFILYPYRDTKEHTGCQVVFSHRIFILRNYFGKSCIRSFVLSIVWNWFLDYRLCQFRLFWTEVETSFSITFFNRLYFFN